MKRFFRALVSFALIISICMGLTFTVGAAVDITTAKAIHFGEDGKLRVMHITDTHFNADNIDESVWLIGKACDREKPEIVVLTGDIAMNKDTSETYRFIDALMQVFQTRNIPVAVTFGNHDSEGNITEVSREALMEYFNRYSCSISVDDGKLLTGCGTYNVPVLSSKDDSVKFNLWIFDSGDYDSEGHYANVSEDQVAWYKQKSLQLENANGGKVYSLAFQHIIVPEVYEALEKTKFNGAYTYSHMYDDKAYYRFNPEVTNYGMLKETPCCGYYNHGQFSAMVERGDVLAMFTGHDHTNAFGVRYKNIDIMNSLSTRYNGDAFSTQYGYRMIEVDESNPSTYTTRAVHWYDLVDGDMVKELRKSDDANYRTALEIQFLGFFEKLFTNIAVFFVQCFTGRTVRY